MPVVNPGIRRYIGSAIQRLFNSASFSAPLTHSLTLERGTGSPTFTRATTATFTDHEGVLRTAIAGEARFTGARRVENLIRLGAAQSSTLAIGASVTMTLPAGTYIFSQGVSVGTATFSGTGGATGTLAASASVRTSVVKTITAGTLIVTGSVAILTDIQVENITGRTDQTTPSEYVSVGVLSAPYHGAGVDGVKYFNTSLTGAAIPAATNLGYLAEAAATNLCLQSQNLSTTWATDGSSSVTEDQYVAPDGTTTMDKVTNIAGTFQHYLKQGIAFSAGVTTASAYLRYVNNRWAAIVMSNGGGLLAASFDLLNGVAGTLGAGTTSTIQATAIANVYRVSITGTMAAGAGNLYISLNSTDTASLENYTAAGTETVGAWGAQVELGSAATSYIPTTTVAVARNADVLTYTGGDIANLKTLAATFRREVGVSNVGVPVALSDGTVNNYSEHALTSATANSFQGGAGGGTQWNTAASSYTAGTTSKVAWSMATNDIKGDKDGTAVTQDTVASIPTVTQLNVGHVAGSFQLNGHVGHIYGWTRNFSQSELGAIDR